MTEKDHLLEILNDIRAYNILFNSKEELAVYLELNTLKSDNFSRLQKEKKSNKDTLDICAMKLNQRVDELISEKMGIDEIQDIYMSCLNVYKDVIKQRRRNADYDNFLESILDNNYINHTREGHNTNKLNDAFEKINSLSSQVALVLMGKGWLQTSPTNTKGINGEKLKEDFCEMLDFMDAYCKKVLDEAIPLVDYYRNCAKNDAWRCQLTMLYAAMDIIAVLDSYVNPNMDANNAFSDSLFTPWDIIDKVWCPDGCNAEEERYEFHVVANNEVNMLHLKRNFDGKQWHYGETTLLFQEQPSTMVVYEMSKKYLVTRILGGTGYNDICYYNYSLEEANDGLDRLVIVKNDGTGKRILDEIEQQKYSYSYIKKRSDLFLCKDEYSFDEIGYIQSMTKSAIYVSSGRNADMLYRVPRIISYGLSEYTMFNSGILVGIPISDINPEGKKYILTFFDANKYIDVTEIQEGKKNEIDVVVPGIKSVKIDDVGVFVELINTETYYVWKAQSGKGKDKSFAQKLNSDYTIMTNKVTYRHKNSKEVMIDQILIDKDAISLLKEGPDSSMEPKVILRTRNIQAKEIIIDDYTSFDIAKMMLRVKITTVRNSLD